jgi:AraC-like DNA-binding protein
MAKALDLVAELPGMVVIHQKIPGSEVGRHSHDEHEFFLPLQGEISVTYKDTTVKAGPGRMLYVPPDLDHSFASSAQGSGERVIWLVDQKTWKKHVDGKFLPCSFPANSLVKELIFYLLVHQKTKGASHFISALIESLGESLASAHLDRRTIFSDHVAGRVKEERIIRALELIDNELASLKLSEIAKRSGLSLRNFNRLFLQETGLTPKDFLILRRVEKAKGLLRKSRMTVTDIALEVGYGSLSKFIATFKRIEGILPSDFRAQESVTK